MRKKLKHPWVTYQKWGPLDGDDTDDTLIRYDRCTRCGMERWLMKKDRPNIHGFVYAYYRDYVPVEPTFNDPWMTNIEVEPLCIVCILDPQIDQNEQSKIP